MRDIYTERFGKELLRLLEDREKLDEVIKYVESLNTKETGENNYGKENNKIINS